MSWSGQTRIFIPFFSVRTWISRAEARSAARESDGARQIETASAAAVNLRRRLKSPPCPRIRPVLRGFYASRPDIGTRCPARGVLWRKRAIHLLPRERTMAKMHEVEYKVLGDDLQFVEIELDPGEAAVAEAGAMMYLEDGIEMTTIFGDGSQVKGDFLDKLVGAGKRLLTGESLFMTVFQNTSSAIRKAAFAAPYPGKIQAMNLAELGGELIAQKESFLAAAKGVSIGIAFQKRFGVGIFGGEGLFYATLKGPGRIWLQSLPFSRLASRIYAAAPQTGGRRREEGSILGGLGNLLDGDGR